MDVMIINSISFLFHIKYPKKESKSINFKTCLFKQFQGKLYNFDMLLLDQIMFNLYMFVSPKVYILLTYCRHIQSSHVDCWWELSSYVLVANASLIINHPQNPCCFNRPNSKVSIAIIIESWRIFKHVNRMKYLV